MSDELIANGGVSPVVSRSLEEWRVQALLFDEVDLGKELLVIEADAVANKHTGGTLARRRELRDAICLRLVEGVSIRRICKEFPVGRNTVAALVAKLEAAGEMEPYKKRVSKRMARVIEGGVELMEELMEKGTVPVNTLPVMVGILSDKKALIDGEPTTILGKTDQGALNQQAYEKWFAELPRVKTIDSKSTGKDAHAQ